MRLFVPRNNEHLITKKEKKQPKDRHPSCNLPPPPYISHTFSTLPRFASGSNPSPTSCHLFALMADPHHIPPGNPAFGRMSALNSPLTSRSGTPLIEQPRAFIVQQLAPARNTLHLTALDLAAFDTETLSGTLLAESTTISLLAQVV